MSDVVNMRKQITCDRRGATTHDWLEEKTDEIDLETFECLLRLKNSLTTSKQDSLLHFYLEMKYEPAQRLIFSSCFSI